MNELKGFLVEQYDWELAAFRDSSDSIPEDGFCHASIGHAPAWQALHVGDWLRLTVLNDRTPNHHFLGWEDQAWVGPMGTEPPPLTENADKATLLARLNDISERVLVYLRGMTLDDLNSMAFSPRTGERPRLQALGLHLRHIAYHRGQVRLGMKEQA